MDWNLKAPSWDLGDVDEANLPNMETVEESSRFGVYRVKGEFSVDLKLGQVGNSGSEVSALPQMHKDASSAAVVSKMAPPAPSGTSKRARAINNSTVAVSCLVDGCNSDLSNCRDYHRRHKVCELHSKTPEVTIGGLKQRFCQQCSRFHSLEQFDERKRSCRKRLDGHNRRRRKPQPEPLTRPGSFLSNYQGTHLLPFSSSTGMVNPSWSTGGLVTSSAGGITKMHIHNNQHRQVHVVDHKQDLFLGTTPTSYRDQVKQLAFLHGDHNTLNNHQNPNPHLPVAASVCQTLLRSSPLSSESSCGIVRSKLMFCDNNNSITSSVHDTPCALSLLSSSSQTHTPGNGLNQMVQVQPHHSMSLMQPLGLSLHGNNNSYESMERVLVHNGSESDHHCSSMYNMGSDGSQGNDAPQLFPYQWD